MTSNEEDNLFEKKRDKKQIIGYAVGFIIIIALGIYIFKGGNGPEKQNTDDVPTAVPTEVVTDAHDETYEEFIENVKKEITYTLTVELPDEKYLSEKKLYREIMTIRNKCGRQMAIIASVGYRDKDLCNYGSSCIVVEFGCDKDAESFNYELRFNVSARTGDSGKLDYYISDLSIEQR